MNAYTFLLENALTSISERNDEKNAMHQIAGIMLDKGASRMFEGETPLMQFLTAKQCLIFTKRIMREITRTVDWQLTRHERIEEQAVEFGGVDGIENPFAAVDSKAERSQEAEDANPDFDIAELIAEMDRLYIDLDTWFLKAEKVVLGWDKAYRLKGLPYYTSQSDRGTWNELYTFEEARMAIASDRAKKQEQAQKEAASVFAALKSA